MARVRSRSDGNKRHSLGFDGDVFGTHTEYFYTSPLLETCIDDVHPNHPYSGGGLNVQRCDYKITPSSRIQLNQGFYNLDCSFIPIYFGNIPNAASSMPNWDMSTDFDGSKGWRKFRPGNAKANVGQFLAELSELPSIPLRQILSARNTLARFRAMGKEYLNQEFGWKPFISDLKDMYHLVRTLDRQLAQLRRDNGRSVRRKGRVRIPAENSSTVTTTGTYLYPVTYTSFYASLNGSRTVSTTFRNEAWFSAKFRYYIEDIDSVRWENRAIQALFGLNPSPSLLWEVLPWSWLIDWAVNIGDVLSNMSRNAVDNLVAEYAFVMNHQSETVTVTETMMFQKAGIPFPVTGKATRVRESKIRDAASPYGFGVSPASLSAKQGLILAALGISRHW